MIIPKRERSKANCPFSNAYNGDGNSKQILIIKIANFQKRLITLEQHVLNSFINIYLNFRFLLIFMIRCKLDVLLIF